ncbi:hypothetical protein ACFL6P_05095 [Candidatus Latescibacterota bacterium]
MKKLEHIINQINERILSDYIEKPVEEVLKNFKINPSEITSHKEFNSIIALLFQELYRHNPGYTRELSENEALGEAIMLLEKNYQTDRFKGYEGALFEATTKKQKGIIFVIERIAEIYKQKEHEKYISCIIKKSIDPTDWNLKKELVEEIVKKYHNWLPTEILEFKPNELIFCYEEMIKAIIAAQNSVKSHLSYINLHKTETNQ